MDIFEIIFGRGLLEIIGGIIRFIWGWLYSLFSSKEARPLSFYFKEEKDETFSNGVGNHVVGVIFFILIVLITIIIMSPSGRKFFNK